MSQPERRDIRTRLKGSFARESFPPKWLLVVAILAVVVGLSLANHRITAAETALTDFVTKACPAGVAPEVLTACVQVKHGEDVLPSGTTGGEPAVGEQHVISTLECRTRSNGEGHWYVVYTDGVIVPDAGLCMAPVPGDK